MLIGGTILVTALLALAGGWLIGRDTLPLPRPPVLAAVCGPLAVVGLILLIINGLAISEAMARRAWPTTTGFVVGSRMVTIGRKNYQPEVTYDFTIDGVEHTAITHLDTPGFGFSSSREDVADNIVAHYPLGLEVKVWVNPDDPGESYLRPGPSWAPLTRYAFGTLLLGLGVLLQAARTLGRQASPPEPPA